MSSWKCAVPNCISKGYRFTRFPIKNKVLLQKWLEVINNEKLKTISDDVLYRGYRVCTKHFEDKWLRPQTYPGSQNMSLERGAYPTLFLNADNNSLPIQQHNSEDSATSTSATSSIYVSGDHNYFLPFDHTVGQNTPSHSQDITSKHASFPSSKLVQTRKRIQLSKERNSVSINKFFKNVIKKPKMIERTTNIIGSLNKTLKEFITCQLRESSKKKKGRRFSANDKVLAISLLKGLRGSYKILQKFLTLPSVATLKRFLRNIPFRPGVNELLEEQIRKQVNSTNSEIEKYCFLVFDEIAIQPHLTYDVGEDTIRGFQNFGDVQRPLFAEHALVFMLRGFESRWKQPYAFMFVGGATKTHDLVRCIKEVLRSALSTNLKVVATLCDQGTSNVAAIKVLKQESEMFCRRNGLNYRDEIFIFEGKEIVHLFDPPHLIKGMRNNLLTKDLTFKINNIQYTAQWEDIIKLYKYDTAEFSMCYKLTDQHVFPDKLKKMSVRHCTQVFSHSVYAALLQCLTYIPIEKHDLTQSARGTAMLVHFFNNLFDSVNGTRVLDSGSCELRGNLSRDSKHIKFWNEEAKPILRTMKFVKVGEVVRGQPPSLTNWIVTLNGLEYLWNSLNSSFDKLNLRSFNQDPLENFFGNIRSHLGANTNPTTAQFISSFQTLCVNNFLSARSIGTNAESDSDKPFTDLANFLQSKPSSVLPENITTTTTTDTTATDNLRRWDIAATSYVAGYVVKKILNLSGTTNCNQCKEILSSPHDSSNPGHVFIANKERISNKLLRPNSNFMSALKCILNIISKMLPLYCHHPGIKKKIVSEIKRQHSFTNLSCGIHDVSNVLIDFTVKFVIFTWCNKINKFLCGKDTRIRPNMDPIQKLALNIGRKYYSKKK